MFSLMCSLMATTLAPCHRGPRVLMGAATRAADAAGEEADEAEAGRRLLKLCHLAAKWGTAKSSPLRRRSRHRVH